MKRPSLVPQIIVALMGIALLGNVSCKQAKKETAETVPMVKIEKAQNPLFFKLSLAQWSMHRMINEGLDPYAFAEKAKAWGFSGLEYVSGLYYAELKKDNFSDAAMKNFIDKSNAEAKKHGMENLLIMVDGQGNLAAVDKAERDAAVKNHYKWVDAAAAMGCHTIRVNLNGAADADAWIKASVDGLSQLATYAKDKNINVTVENHGGFSSNGALLAQVMKTVNMDNCGTLPDFGNFCMEWGEWPACNNWYDRYKGMEELMPYAKAVSAKSHDFDADGNEKHSDYTKMLQIVKNAGYKGYIGVEYEGSELDEEAGILATRDLLLKAGANLP